MPRKVLVMDGEPRFRDAARLYLTREGLAVDAAADGREALAKLAQRLYDPGNLDLMLPEVDGWEVYRRVRQGSQVPILMLTARSTVTDRVLGLSLGADD